MKIVVIYIKWSLLFFLLYLVRKTLHIHYYCHSSQNPLSRAVTSLQLSRKHISCISIFSLIGRALIHSLVFLAFGRQRKGFTINNWDNWEHFFWSWFLHESSSWVPSGSFEDKSIDIWTIFWSVIYLFNCLFGDISLNVEFVEFNAGCSSFLIGSCGDNLLDGSEIGLRIEESWDHDDFGQVERVISESIELLNSL